jgi:hypothetical protein
MVCHVKPCCSMHTLRNHTSVSSQDVREVQTDGALRGVKCALCVPPGTHCRQQPHQRQLYTQETLWAGAYRKAVR